MSTPHEDDINRLRTALGRISRTIDRQVTGDGLTRTQLSVLGSVARHGSVGLGELAEIEGLNPTMLSRIAGKLESLGLLERSPGADDRRAVVARITPEGKKLHTRLRRERSALLKARLAELDPAEITALLAAVPALEALSEAFRTYADTSTAAAIARVTAGAR